MTSRVIYLNAWLDCPDVILRRNYELQRKITEAKIHFFYKMKEEGVSESKKVFLYMAWVQKNRSRLKLAVEPMPDEDNSEDE